MQALNLILLTAQLLVFGAVAVYLHAVRRRYGLVPLILYLACLVAFLHALGPSPVFLQIEGLRVVTSDAALIPVVLLIVLIIYDVDGTPAARVLLGGIVGVSALVMALQLLRDWHIVLGGVIAGDPTAQALTSRSWRITIASSVAFVLSLVAIATVDQTIRNRVPGVPRWVAPGIALMAALTLDDIVFRIGAFGWTVFVETFPGGLVTKNGAAVLLWPMLGAYLARAEGREGRFAGDRSAFDLLFGTYGHREETLRVMERRHRRTAEQLRSVVSAAPIIVFGVDRDGTFTLSEGAGLAALGLEPGQVVGQSALELFPQVEAELRHALAGHGFATAVEVENLSYDVTYIPLTEGGEVTGVFGVATDVTARRTAEHALEESEVRFRSSFQHAPVGMILTDTEGAILRANPAMQAILKRDEGELLGVHFSEFTHPEDRVHDARAVPALIQGAIEQHRVDKRFVPKGGEPVWGHTRISVVRGPDGEPAYFVIVVEDLTERRAADARLRQAQKMEAVGQLTGGVAHDFNNLLAVIMGGLELALDEAEEGDEGSTHLEAALASAQRGAALTQRLLAFSRKQALQPVPVDITELIAETRTLLVRTLGEEVSLEVWVAEDVGSCLADRHQVENALINLAVNARDAMPEGGSLELHAMRRLVAGSDASRLELEPGTYVELSVSDSGVGIVEEDRARVFDPFFTTKDVGRGSGLGLSMVYGFVRQSGGAVEIESEPGEGTTVTILLPASEAAARSVDASAAPVGEHDPAGLRVLLVEDDPAVRDLIGRMLHVIGYDVVEAEDGPTALDLVEKMHFDALLTDVILPAGMSGPQLAERILVDRPDLPTVFTSGYTGDALVERGAIAPGVRLLTKPFKREELARVMSEAFDA